MKAEDNSIVFVVDRSGSMRRDACKDVFYYSRYDFAAAGVMKAITSLQGKQKFNIIIFDTEPFAFKSRPVLANDKAERNIRDAAEFLGTHDPRHTTGATNIEKALRLAYSQSGVDAIHILSDGSATKGCSFNTVPCRPRTGGRDEIPPTDSVPLHTVLFMPGDDSKTRERVQNVMQNLALYTSGSFREPFPEEPTICPPRVGLRLNVTGAGIAEVNGLWWQAGSLHGRPRYQRAMQNNHYFIEWEPLYEGYWHMFSTSWFGVGQECLYKSRYNDRKISQRGWRLCDTASTNMLPVPNVELQHAMAGGSSGEDDSPNNEMLV